MNAAFALPMKYSRSWKWENLWLVFSVVGIFIVPWALAFGLVPGLTQVYAGVTPRALLLPLVFGLLWGFAQVTFGLSLRMVGVALTFAVVSGLASLSGSLVPLLVFHPEDLFRPRGLLLLLSIPFLIVGLIFYAFAGRRREKEQADPNAGSSPPKSSFATGMALCIFTGIFGSSYNLGFAFGGRCDSREPAAWRRPADLNLCSVGSCPGSRVHSQPCLLYLPAGEESDGESVRPERLDP